MQCYTELLPPSAVSHAVSLPFLAPTVDNLIVAKTSLLQIYTIKRFKTYGRSSLRSSPSQSRLVLIGEYPLSGTVTALASIKLPNTRSGGDALLVTTQQAKMSLLEWDPEIYYPSTISIHYYENPGMLSHTFDRDLLDFQTVLAVDPSSRCAALKFGARQLAILPFRQPGDELVDEEFDADLTLHPDNAPLEKTRSGLIESVGGEEREQTPYKKSFVLPLTALDPTLTHPLHLAFLHEYREPTFGVLSTPVQASNTLPESRKDVITYTVFTLDLEQRASTNLVTLQKLPSDLWKVVPLPLPIGGAVLIGVNEFIHVDQSGKANAVAVNEFATKTTNFSMIDQSSLNLRLENCEVTLLSSDNTELLVILNDGSFLIMGFNLLGRNVSGINISRVSAGDDGSPNCSPPSSVVRLGEHMIFIGSDGGDSVLMEWILQTSSVGKKRSYVQMLGHDEEDEDNLGEEADEDDLYVTGNEPIRSIKSTGGFTTPNGDTTHLFTRVDGLTSIGPINDICFGHSASTSADKLEMLVATGLGQTSRLSFLKRGIVSRHLRASSFEKVQDGWALKTKRKDAQNDLDVDAFDDLLFLYDGEKTSLYDIVTRPEVSINNFNGHDNHTSHDVGPLYLERMGTGFDQDGETINMSVMANGTRIVQCKRTEVWIYDAADISLSQIIPMTHDETDSELKIVHTSFCDPFLLVLRDDGSIQIFCADDGGDIEPLAMEAEVNESRWLGGCLYTGELTYNVTAVFLLSEEGGLHIFNLPELKSCFTAAMLMYLPSVLRAGMPQKKFGAKETLVELLVADVGRSGMAQPFLILRSAIDGLISYEPFRFPVVEDQHNWTSGLGWRKVPSTYIPRFDETSAENGDGRPRPLHAMRLGPRQVVCVPGTSPSMIVKENCSLLKVIPLREREVDKLFPIHRAGCEYGFVLVTSGHRLHECSVSDADDLSSGWCMTHLPTGQPPQEVRCIAYHEFRRVYVVATCKNVDFRFPEEDTRHQEHEDIAPRPQIPQYSLHLLSAKSHTVIHSLEMPYLDIVTSVKVMSLEISENTHEQKSMVVVGTATQRGEDMPAKGAVLVFDILDVVPDPERPESGIRLQAVSTEETRGAITAIEPFGNGLIGTTQGQKIMIRGLKEDGSCLPVAFLDALCHMTQLKTLARSGLWLAGDAWKGLWFGGFVEEPYKLSVLGKSRSHLEVITAEFLPFDGQLFVIVIDASMDLHVLQYDPENPKSLSGTRLLHRSTFHTGHFPTVMKILPSTLAPPADQSLSTEESDHNTNKQPASNSFQILTATRSGTIGLVIPVHEVTYRRLGALQTHLSAVLDNVAGLNPRSYRAVESEGLASRGVLDGNTIQRINELGSARRAEALVKAGSDMWSVRSDLEILGGGGLGFL